MIITLHTFLRKVSVEPRQATAIGGFIQPGKELEKKPRRSLRKITLVSEANSGIFLARREHRTRQAWSSPGAWFLGSSGRLAKPGSGRAPSTKHRAPEGNEAPAVWLELEAGLSFISRPRAAASQWAPVLPLASPRPLPAGGTEAACREECTAKATESCEHTGLGANPRGAHDGARARKRVTLGRGVQRAG